ncbi:homoserine kinase type II [Desulfatibacillum alkenivorans DSM 16219]|uniref:Homoserine kinase type II n=1 Tax=Desulfatibacillum alkenivorans DSM 16219 TaxID=1121393 RepID=A0A1M6BNN2_9BACT|nr:aminoglycoside phosphotransferase family protein [Desulfatibacillum alkenivorans]SHI50158.1 homoserine kinase type II [Desulfatibacillum alkenivorans DSM 16219]
MTLKNQTIEIILKAYELQFFRIRPDLPLEGSPERSLERMAVEDDQGGLFLLEALKPETVNRKQTIAAAIEALSRADLGGIAPYLSYEPGRRIISLEDGYYQLSPYIEGSPLPRPEYLDQAWRGRAMADFLVMLRQAWTKAEMPPEESDDFSLQDFVPDLVRKISARDPRLLKRISPALSLAESFLPVFKDLPLGFCHGDFHPVNVIWGEKSIRAVIDWEFCGMRPELYDAALMIGCAGFEYPPAISGDYVGAFLIELWKSGIYERESWEKLFPLMLLVRFAWLSEWLRGQEDAMISLETDYLNFLAKHAQDITALFAGIRSIS